VIVASLRRRNLWLPRRLARVPQPLAARIESEDATATTVGDVSITAHAAFRRNIPRTLDAVRTARYERTLAPSSSLENSCANRRRTSAGDAPVRSHNELIARSCLAASWPDSKSDFIETPPHDEIDTHVKTRTYLKT